MSGHAAAFLQACRNVIGDPPRRFSLRDRRDYLSLPPPKWVTPTEPFSRYFEDYKRVLREGRLVWGAVVQANDHLFAPGSHDHPAEIIYAPDPGHGNYLATLAQLAHRIFALKGTTPNDEGLARLAYHLTDEMQRVFGLPVPMALGNGVGHELSSVVFHRKHLPSGYLKRSILPVLVSPDPRLVMVLPEKYWPAGLLEWWEAALTGAPRPTTRRTAGSLRLSGVRHWGKRVDIVIDTAQVLVLLTAKGPRKHFRATARARVIGPRYLGGRRSPQS